MLGDALTTLFFAHGTGVRRPGYQRTLADINAGMAKAGRPDVKAVGVSWGEQAGVKVTDALIADMLPPTGAKGPGPTDPEVSAQLWTELMADPLFELRIAALRRPAGPVVAQPGGVLPSAAIKTALRALDLGGAPPAGGVTLAELRAGAAWLADGDGAPTLTEAAAAAAASNDPTLVGATARALVAHVLVQSRGEVGQGPDALYLAEARDALVKQVEDSLSGGVKGGPADWLFGFLKPFLLAKATSVGKDRRAGLMTAVSPGTGDILLSQRRGDAILDLLKTGIEAVNGEVVVIGHSLGGVHLVNLLSGPKRPQNVTKLITVASQSAFFLACDGMESLRLGQGLRQTFTPWLNFYDRSDFLSFRASKSFPGVAGIDDYEVVSGVPFPDSHGAYWRMPEVYKRIAAFI